MQKREDKRPQIDEIIMSDIFQKKARLVKITLPLTLNKEKMAQKEEKEQAAASKKSINVITREPKVFQCKVHAEFWKTCKSTTFLINTDMNR